MRHRHSAFTLAEILIVVCIVGLLAAMAVQAVTKVRQKSRTTTAINDLKQFAGAFTTYRLDNSAWPANADALVVPAEMTGQIPATNWATPIGDGHAYDWDLDVYGVKAAISIRPTSLASTDPIFAGIDKELDDGNLATGSFRFISDRYMYILQE